MRKRRLKILLFILLAPFVLLCAFLLFERIRGQISLAHYKHELANKGEKLTFQELIPPTPEGENGAAEFSRAVERLKRGTVMPDNAPPAMKIVPSGRAIVGFREDPWVTEIVSQVGERITDWTSWKATNTWEQLTAELKTNEVTLREIRASLDSPVFDNNLNYSQGFEMSTSRLAPPKSASVWFGAAAQLALRQGQNQAALDDAVAEIRLARVLAEDRLAISELVRIAIGATAKSTTWEVLQAQNLTDQQLVQLQAAWQSTSFVANMASSFEGERAFGESGIERIRSSNREMVGMIERADSAFSFLGSPQSHNRSWRETVATDVYCRIWRFAWSHQDEYHYLRSVQGVIEIARGLDATKSYADVAPELNRQAEKHVKIGFYDKVRFLSRGLPATLTRMLERAVRMETDRAVVVSAIALKRYSLRYGKPAASLDALVPEFLSAVPIDYMDGNPIKYHLNTDGNFTLYSVGENGRDDGGDASLLPDKSSYRNLWNRRDFVWPAPATGEETEAWRKEQIKD